MNDLLIAALALVPSAGLLYLFYVIMRSILRADRNEREALREWEDQQVQK